MVFWNVLCLLCKKIDINGFSAPPRIHWYQFCCTKGKGRFEKPRKTLWKFSNHVGEQTLVYLFFFRHLRHEGSFRLSRSQEYLHSPSDICCTDDCLLIMDEMCPSYEDEFFKHQNISPSASPKKDLHKKRSHKSRNREKMGPALRIILSTDCEETPL